MKTLIINGSPRKNGDCITLVNEMMKYLVGEIRIVNTYYENISPCIDCRYCLENKGCLIEDDMQAIYKLLNEVDNVIIASPLYFSELTGKLLSFASRFQCFYAAQYIRKDSDFKLKNKKAALVIAGGGNGGPAPAIARADIIFKQINAEVVGQVLSLNTDNLPAKDDIKALNKARELAIQLNNLNL